MNDVSDANAERRLIELYEARQAMTDTLKFAAGNDLAAARELLAIINEHITRAESALATPAPKNSSTTTT
jgi:hypothetical protein